MGERRPLQPVRGTDDLMARRSVATTRRMDVVCQILREDNGLTNEQVAARMSPDLLGLRSHTYSGEPIDWTPERLGMNGALVVYRVALLLEHDGRVFGQRDSTRAMLWFLHEDGQPEVDQRLIDDINSIPTEGSQTS